MFRERHCSSIPEGLIFDVFFAVDDDDVIISIIVIIVTRRAIVNIIIISIIITIIITINSFMHQRRGAHYDLMILPSSFSPMLLLLLFIRTIEFFAESLLCRSFPHRISHAERLSAHIYHL